MSGARIAFNVLGAIILAVFAVLGFMHFLGPSTSGSTPVTGNPGVRGIITAALGTPRVIVDQEIAVSAHGAQMRGFTLPAAHTVEVVAEGRRHANKDFNVYVIPASEWPNFTKGTSARQVQEFEGLKVRSFGHKGTLSAGSWAVVVQNSENIFETMVVHLKVVIDP
jgi:hypothetical protein